MMQKSNKNEINQEISKANCFIFNWASKQEKLTVVCEQQRRRSACASAL